MTWLAITPLGVVEAHRVMLPRLRARDALRQLNIVGVATGSMDEKSRDKLIRHWQDDARVVIGKPQRAAKATPEQLRAMGIDVVIEPPQAAGA